MLTLALVVVGLGVVVVVVFGFVVPHLIVRRDERRARPPTGLGEPIPGLDEVAITTDDGATLHVYIRGTGPTLLLVHGLSLDHRSWHYQYLDLTDRFRVIGVDLRGHGTSTTGSQPIGPQRFAADLAATIERLDLRNAVVVGHSLGGTVVGQFCADHRDVVDARVSGLVFVDTFAAAIAGEGRFREMVSPTLIRVAAKLRSGAKPKGTPPSSAFAYTMARTPFGPDPQPEHVRFTMRMASTVAPGVIGAATVANLHYDVRDGLKAIDVPALIIRGAHDTLATERSVAQLEAALAQPEVVTFESCGHLPMLEDRERFAETIAAFASRVTAPR